MKNLNPESSQKILLFAGGLHLVWGLILVFSSSTLSSTAVDWLQFYGLFTALMGLAYLLASIDAVLNWPIVLIGFLSKLFVPVLIVKMYMSGNAFSLLFFSLLLLLEFIWPAPFYALLNHAFLVTTREESAPKKFNDLIKFVKTNEGKTLLEMSEQQKVLLIFVRHFGCMFCRETVSEIAKLEKKIEGKQLTTVFVHMSDPAFGDQFFSQYYKRPVLHVSDPQRFLYKSLDLKRGSLGQIFGPKNLFRALWVSIFKGHGVGAPEGDVLQLGGYFILSRGQVIFEHKTCAAGEFFELDFLPEV